MKLATQEIENATMSFTVGQLLFLCSAFVLIATVVGIIAKLIQWIKSPEVKQNEVISAIQMHQQKQDVRIDEMEQFLKKDNESIKSIKRGNVIVQQSILALMNHAINDNDIDKLEESRDRLQEYLIER